MSETSIAELFRDTAADKSNSKTYLIFITVLCCFGITSIVAVLVVRPTEDNTAIIATILGFLTPIIGTLMAVMIKDIHVSINSRMTELLALTQKSARAEGKLEERDNQSSHPEIGVVGHKELEKVLPVTVKLTRAETKASKK